VLGCWGRKLAWLQLRIRVIFLVQAFEFEAVPVELAGFKGHAKLTHEPKKCFVRLRELLD
jgi:hypothetical protein